MPVSCVVSIEKQWNLHSVLANENKLNSSIAHIKTLIVPFAGLEYSLLNFHWKGFLRLLIKLISTELNKYKLFRMQLTLFVYYDKEI